MDRNTQNIATGMLRALALQDAGLDSFKTVDDVQKWVDEHGGGDIGEAALRKAAARASGGPRQILGLIEEWLASRNRARADTHASEVLEVERRAASAAERSALASERAARYAMWSALISTVSTIVALAAYLISRP